jgi:signal transduction histidine kinase
MPDPRRSRSALRRRLFVGSIFWTLGLFALTGVVLTHIMFAHPRAPGIFHHVFSNAWFMSVVGVALLAAGVWNVRRGVSAISQLRSKLGDVHAGRAPRLAGEYPSEVEPLVADLNALLDSHDANVRRAQTKAGDLAHGLKTPLAILAHEADRARSAGQIELAAAIAEQVDRMRRQIDYHLAHARAAASSAAPGARTSVLESALALQRALQRLYAERGLSIDVDVDSTVSVRAHRQDFEEMLGNLLDNACKWAKTRVTISSGASGLSAEARSAKADAVVIVVDDDGPGLDAAMRESVLQRGVRADQAAPGSGLGLAIVRDLAELYGGSIALGSSPLGGLRAMLTLPGVPGAQGHGAPGL